MTVSARPSRPRTPGAAWQDGRPGAPVLAALDLGTNNCRLLIARPRRPGFQVIDAFSRIVRLGQGLAGAGRMTDEAMARAVDALTVCAAKMSRQGVTLSRVVATEACRRAENCQEFLDRVEAETGLRLEIISAREEAQLALAGCVPLLDPAIPGVIAFDIGGGSTELAWVRRDDSGRQVELDTLSLPLGVVTLTECHGGDCFDRQTYRQMVADCAARLVAFGRRNDIAGQIAAGRVQMIGTSGTVTTLAGVNQRLPRYIRARVDGTSLSFADVRRIAGELAAMSYEARAANPCIGHERADLVVAGCAILEAICESWPVGRLTVADRGVREGILFGLLAILRFPYGVARPPPRGLRR